MRIFVVLVLLFGLSGIVPLLAEGSSSKKRGHRLKVGGPWLGIRTDRMNEATAAQLKGVPLGFGILIERVEPDSPAFEAGLQPHDVLWKYDDQLVANKDQLYSLMKRTGVSLEATLTVSRGGEDVVLPIIIGVRRASDEEMAKAATEVLMPPLPGAIVRMLKGKHSGYLTEGGVTVRLVRAVNGFEYSVSKGEELLAEGILMSEDAESWPQGIDEETRLKLKTLLQSLENAEERDSPSPRQPRVRRVPNPLEHGKE